MLKENLNEEFPYLTKTDLEVVLLVKSSDPYWKFRAAVVNDLRREFQEWYNGETYFGNGLLVMYSKTNSREHQLLISCLIYYLVPEKDTLVFPEASIGMINSVYQKLLQKDYEPDVVVTDTNNVPTYLIEIECNKEKKIVDATRKKIADCLLSIPTLVKVYIIRIDGNKVFFNVVDQSNVGKDNKLDVGKREETLTGANYINIPVTNAVNLFKKIK